ncbi:probable D-amino-acid oxidase [Cephalotrichum gorgonifer]|uniref:Probable D-amino-acid oxidase n=1 Tax=Cephalotrichum gorgonifer TaxID=2041049 RepID=A0AAE8MV98_9PEZI|nr:probable D-amino-acid oxidase [Cephalotrichum gorgonifer]
MPQAIVVLGAGVIGLTSALLLSRDPENVVTVLAKHMPGDYDIEYTSPWAGANVLPMSLEPNNQWERRTWLELKRLTEEVPNAGIHFQKTRVYRRDKDQPTTPGSNFYDALFARDPWFKNMFDNYRELAASEVPAGHDSGCEFTSLCMNTAIFLPYLVGECLRNGVVFKRGVVEHVADAAAFSHAKAGGGAPIVINATGLGSLKLGGVEDAAVKPARGQVVVVRNVAPYMVATSGSDDGEKEMTYIMGRAAGGGTILGGTYDKGNWNANPDPNIATRIMKRAVDIHPELTDGKGVEGLDVIRHGVGLRPYREGGVRIEREAVRGRDGRGSVEVVHNYGHAGWGYQGSFGCAERVVELVNEIKAGPPRAKL